MVPPCRSTMSRAMARPRPVPPPSRVRASSRRVNRSKIRSRWSAGCRDRRRPRSARPRWSSLDQRDGDRVAAWRSRVVDQVADRPGELVGVAEHLGRGDAGGVDRRPGRRRGGGGPAATRCRRGRPVLGGRSAAPASLRASCEQVVDQALQLARLVEHAADASPPDRRARGGRGRPRARCGCGSAGSAARARRRRRTAAAAGRRPRAGRAWRSCPGQPGDLVVGPRSREPAGAGRRRRCRRPRRGWPPPGAGAADQPPDQHGASASTTTGTATVSAPVERGGRSRSMSSSVAATCTTRSRPSRGRRARVQEPEVGSRRRAGRRPSRISLPSGSGSAIGAVAGEVGGGGDHGVRRRRPGRRRRRRRHRERGRRRVADVHRRARGDVVDSRLERFVEALDRAARAASTTRATPATISTASDGDRGERRDPEPQVRQAIAGHGDSRGGQPSSAIR